MRLGGSASAVGSCIVLLIQENQMKYLHLIVFPVLLLLTACTSSDTPPDVATGDFVSVNFNLMTGDRLKGTRADDQGHTESDSEFRNFEDGIDMEDVAIFIFAKIAGSASEEKLVHKFTNLLDSDGGRISVVGSESNYFINLMIPKNELYDALDEYAITPEGKSIITFRMLILANCMSSSANVSAMWNSVTGPTFTAVISQLAEWSFPMSDIYNAGGGPGVETIYSNKKDHCPMFGTNVFSATEAALYYSRPEDSIYLGEVNLLRALAKVRVVDNIQNKDAAGYPYIVAAEFMSSQDVARPVPAGSGNYENGQQVHTPNIYQANSNLNIAATYKLGIIPQAWSITPASKRTGNVFIGFVPEQKIGHPNNNIEAGMPVFHITIANRKADGSVEFPEYNVPMTSYNGVNFSFGQNILRNHIYTLSVDDFGSKLSLQVDVVPYRSCVLEPYFGLDRD